MNNLQDSIVPYLVKEYLIYTIYFLAMTVLILLLFLVVHKLYTEKKSRKRQKYADEYKHLIGQYLEGVTSSVKQPDNNLKYEAFVGVCVDMLSHAGREMGASIKKLIKETGALEYYIKIAGFSSWKKRFFAIEMLGFFMMDYLKEFFLKKGNTDRSPEVKAKSLWALSLIADKDALLFITKKLASEEISNSSKFNEYVYTNVIRSFRRKEKMDVFTSFLRDIKDDEAIPLVIKRDLIGACCEAGVSEVKEIVNDYFSDYQHDSLMKIACLRALSAAGTLNVKAIVTGLTDSDWKVRAVSAKAASAGPDDRVISHLQRLLYDSVYIVRINAARTLAKLGEKGLSVLKKEKDSKDRFVRDSIFYILDEVRGNV